VKRCPLCQREYPDNFRFCDSDASPLIQIAESPSVVIAKLLLRLPDGSTRTVTLDDNPLTIGKEAGNALVIADNTVSRQHGVIQKIQGQYLLSDRGSRNGIYANGARVGEQGHYLRNGDELKLGNTRISFRTETMPDSNASVRNVPPTIPSPIAPTIATPPVPQAQQSPPPPSPPPPSQIPPPAPQPPVPQTVVSSSAPPAAALSSSVTSSQPRAIIEGRYQIEEKIYEDSIGRLYRAKRILLGDHVAIRMLRPELITNAVALERFRRQAQVAVRVRHPNSVQVHDFGVTADGAPYVVEELLSGFTLRDLLLKEGGLTLPRVVNILNQICGAVHTAHLNGMVLRDIRPQTIFVEHNPDGSEIIKVSGYSLARLEQAPRERGMTLSDQVITYGSPQYISPEQWRNQPLDSRADVYSLGIILFEMLTGTVPFDAVSHSAAAQQHLTAPIPDLTDYGRPDLDEGVAAVVTRALAKEPRERQPTAIDLANQFQAVCGFAGGMMKATRVFSAPPAVPAVPAAVAGEVALPSVVAKAEDKGRGVFNPAILALLAEAFCSRISSGLLKTAVPLYALLVFGLDISAIMGIVLLQNVVPLLLRPVFGNLADKYGKKKIFVVSLTIRTIVSFLYIFATWPMMFVIGLIRGVADSAKGPSASAMIADRTDEKHIAQAYSWYTTTKSVSGGIGESVAAFLLVVLIGFFAGRQMVTARVAVMDATDKNGKPAEVFLSEAEQAQPGQPLASAQEKFKTARVVRSESRELPLREVPINDLPKVVNQTFLRKTLTVIFIASTLLSILSLILVMVFIKEKAKDPSKKKKKDKDKDAAPAVALAADTPQPNVWAFALLGMALTAPAYMVTGEFFVILAVKLDITPGALGTIKLVAETILPLLFGPFFGWLADRVGTGKVVALRSIANLITSVLFWITPWFAGTALLGALIGLARGLDEIGKAAFKPTWGAIAARVSSFNLSQRARTMSILEGGVDASDLAFPVLSGIILQFLSLGPLMLLRAVLAMLAEVYAFFLMRKYKI
jgi:serine/threonine-protein kinase